MNYQISDFLLTSFNSFSLNFDFTNDWVSSVSKAIIGDFNLTEYTSKLPSIKTTSLSSYGLQNFAFVFVFISKLMIGVFTAVVLLGFLFLFFIVTKILKWKLLIKLRQMISFAVFWNIPIQYLQQTSLDLFVSAFYTMRIAFFDNKAVDTEAIVSGPTIISEDGTKSKRHLIQMSPFSIFEASGYFSCVFVAFIFLYLILIFIKLLR